MKTTLKQFKFPVVFECVDAFWFVWNWPHWRHAVSFLFNDEVSITKEKT